MCSTLPKAGCSQLLPKGNASSLFYNKTAKEGSQRLGLFMPAVQYWVVAVSTDRERLAYSPWACMYPWDGRLSPLAATLHRGLGQQVREVLCPSETAKGILGKQPAAIPAWSRATTQS